MLSFKFFILLRKFSVSFIKLSIILCILLYGFIMFSFDCFNLLKKYRAFLIIRQFVMVLKIYIVQWMVNRAVMLGNMGLVMGCMRLVLGYIEQVLGNMRLMLVDKMLRLVLGDNMSLVLLGNMRAEEV